MLLDALVRVVVQAEEEGKRIDGSVIGEKLGIVGPDFHFQIGVLRAGAAAEVSAFEIGPEHLRLEREGGHPVIRDHGAAAEGGEACLKRGVSGFFSLKPDGLRDWRGKQRSSGVPELAAFGCEVQSYGAADALELAMCSRRLLGLGQMRGDGEV